MSELTLLDNPGTVGTATSPFDAMRRTRLDGSEFWSARDLMPTMTYRAWAEFKPVVERAMMAAGNQGYQVTDLFRTKTEKTAGRPREDVELSRLAAYLVAMNGDPRKAEVAAAQAYFAIQTRQAEVTRALTREERLAQAVLESAEVIAEQQAAIAVRDEKIAIDAPKVEAFEEFMLADGTYGMAVVADMLGWGRNTMLKQLRDAGVLSAQQSMWNVPLRKHMDHFKIVPFRKRGIDIGYTTYVRPTGVDFIRNTIGIGPGIARCAGAQPGKSFAA